MFNVGAVRYLHKFRVMFLQFQQKIVHQKRNLYCHINQQDSETQKCKNRLLVHILCTLCLIVFCVTYAAITPIIAPQFISNGGIEQISQKNISSP